MNLLKKSLFVLVTVALLAGITSFAYAAEEKEGMIPDGVDDAVSVDDETNAVQLIEVKPIAVDDVDWDALRPNVDYIPNRVVVTFEDNTTWQEVDSYLAEQSMELNTVISWPGTEYEGPTKVITATIGERETVREAMLNKGKSPIVKYVEPSFLATPDVLEIDESCSDEWADEADDDMSDGGGATPDASVNDTNASDQYYLNTANVKTAWDLSRTSRRVTVAVLDTGIDLTHPDLVNNIDSTHAWDVYNNTALTGDLETHGTSVAGVVAARANNNMGIAGVSYNAIILPIRIAHSSGGNIYASYENMAAGINKALNCGATNLKVINISYTGSQTPPSVLQTAINNATSAGVSVVCSAGNDGTSNPRYPSDLNNVISVISVNSSNQKASSSNYGAAKDICAPGVGIYTTCDRTNADSSGYDTYSGTSFAAPVISGALAMMYASNTSLTPATALSKLISTATDLGATGFDNTYANGLVHAQKAVRSAISPGTRTSIASATISGVNASYYYTGSNIAPNPTVVVNGTTLTKGTHYNVYYNYNKALGSIADITIIGKGTYYGATGKTFKIKSKWNRLYGSTALATMQAINQTGFSSSSKVVLATLDSYYDALTAGGLAGIYNCPIVLTSGTSLSSQASSEITRLGASTVVIVGGTGSVSDSVKNQVAALSGVTSVIRVAGSNAADTAIKVFNKGGSSWGTTALVANLSTFQDALSCSPYSYKKHAPLFLTGSGNTLDTATLSAIQSGGFTKVLIIGGTSSVPASVVTQLSGIGVSSQRLYGANAVATSVAVANYCTSNGMSANKMAVATADTYYDALVGGAFCGHNNAPLLLVTSSNYSPVTQFISNKKSSIAQGYVLGGTSSVSATVYNQLVAAAY